ncbi:MAG: matrixin family metalloprotease, partial [Gemmataceae bacterium]
MVPPRKSPLGMESLEERLTPALTIQFNYSLDSSGFFQNPTHRAALEQAGATIASQIDTRLPAITSGGTNNLTARFFDPATGSQREVSNLSVPADTIIVYVGARDLTASEAGVGGTGGYRLNGDAGFRNVVQNRNPGGVSLWGGSISFDSSQNWNFTLGQAPSSNQTDFYTVASHELAHVLGLGTSSQFFDLVNPNGTFEGATANQVYGGAPPISPDGAHFATSAKLSSEIVSLQPSLKVGEQYGLSRLEYAALADIGWKVSLSDGSAPLPITPP